MNYQSERETERKRETGGGEFTGRVWIEHRLTIIKTSRLGICNRSSASVPELPIVTREEDERKGSFFIS